MLLATAACHFSTSELQKVLWDRQFFNILTCKCASRHSGVQFFDDQTPKSASELRCFVHFHFKMCFAPQRRANFSTSKLQKALRSRGVWYIFTSKCVSRHSGVQFLDIWTSKSASELSWFAHFHLQMCFSPQRRAIFGHLNFKKCSEAEVVCTFSLANVLRATAVCNFWTSELQKVLRSWGVLYIFSSKCAFRHSVVQFLISLLSTYLRTRRFNRPTFRLTRHTNHWKNTSSRDFSNIWRGCIFFHVTFALLHLLSADLTTLLLRSSFCWLDYYCSFHLLFNSPYCRKFLFKLPSINKYINVSTHISTQVEKCVLKQWMFIQRLCWHIGPFPSEPKVSLCPSACIRT